MITTERLQRLKERQIAAIASVGNPTPIPTYVPPVIPEPVAVLPEEKFVPLVAPQATGLEKATHFFINNWYKAAALLALADSILRHVR